MTPQFGFINGKTEQKITKFIALMIFLFQTFSEEQETSQTSLVNPKIS